jgi:putative transposase
MNFKSFKYRVYPTNIQIKRLEAWNDALRFLWNIAHEQRKIGLAKSQGEKRYPSFFDQQKELTELRAELPWLADVPRHICAQCLIDIDQSWQRYFSKLSYIPNWKSKDRDFLSFTETDPKVWSLKRSTLRFPKLGNLKSVIHRPLEGKPKTCTLKRDGDQWFATIICEIEVPDPTPRTEPRVGIDRGIANFGGTSDNNFIPNPEFLKHSLVHLARANRKLSRKKKGSKNQIKAKNRVARIHRKIRRQRHHYLHILTSQLSKSHGIVALEKLNIAGMIQGNNLGRSIADASWSKFAELLRYKLAWTGGTLIEVPAAYSSQECSRCGHVDEKNRLTQAKFNCVKCGYEDHADLNAAKNILHRANRSVLLVEGRMPEVPLRNKKSVKLRVPRSQSKKLLQLASS